MDITPTAWYKPLIRGTSRVLIGDEDLSNSLLDEKLGIVINQA